MTTQPVGSPQLLTVAEYLEIGEIEFGYAELVEGRLLMSPSPALRHNDACSELWLAIRNHLSRELHVAQDIDVDLQLAAPDAPGFVRRPDLVVVQKTARDRINRDGGLLRASDAVLVVEVVSPGSRRIDYHHKRGEYADAGIPHYWIVDTTEPVSLTACHLAGEFGYQDAGPVTGTFTVAEPFPAEIDLDALL